MEAATSCVAFPPVKQEPCISKAGTCHEFLGLSFVIVFALWPEEVDLTHNSLLFVLGYKGIASSCIYVV